MKFCNILIVSIAVFRSFVNATAIAYEDMNDFEIARIFVQKATVQSGNLYNNTNVYIAYPTHNVSWTVGELVNVTYSSTRPENETVSVFFFDKTPVLAGGPLTTKVFPFYVPVEAVSPVNGTSSLVSVRRQSHHLLTVDSVIIKVLPGPPHQ